MTPDNIKEYWDNNNVESMYDKNMLEIEIQTILEHLDESDSVIDIGCGEGEGTVHYFNKVKELIAIDFSDTRLAKLKANNDKIETMQMDMRKLTFDKIQKKFSKAITQRSLINLKNFEEQKEVIENIHSILEVGGKYIMVEGFTEGVEAINEIRTDFNLSPIEIKWHNCFFVKNDLLDFMSPYFKLEYTRDFSLFFFLTRVFNAILKKPEIPKWDDPVNNLAKTMELNYGNKFIKGVSRLELLVFSKC